MLDRDGGVHTTGGERVLNEPHRSLDEDQLGHVRSSAMRVSLGTATGDQRLPAAAALMVFVSGSLGSFGDRNT